ncbi:hypothetical protein J2S50_002059 [Streptomyces sp. DSM 40167]|nr:hypothetical protein [Streptomyces sp. DSM 40167]
MILHHLVLDTSKLVALSGNRQVSALIHRAYYETETRLWVPAPCVLDAERELLGNWISTAEVQASPFTWGRPPSRGLRR